MTNKVRQKAQAVFENTNFVFKKKCTFEEAYPLVDEIKIIVIESGKGIKEWNTKRHFDKMNTGEYIDCRNPRCYNGGFSIGRIIKSMVKDNKEHLEEEQFCQGYEGSPMGKRRHGNCYNTFHITIQIKYKEKDNVT